MYIIQIHNVSYEAMNTVCKDDTSAIAGNVRDMIFKDRFIKVRRFPSNAFSL